MLDGVGVVPESKGTCSLENKICESYILHILITLRSYQI